MKQSQMKSNFCKQGLILCRNFTVLLLMKQNPKFLWNFIIYLNIKCESLKSNFNQQVKGLWTIAAAGFTLNYLIGQLTHLLPTYAHSLY